MKSKKKTNDELVLGIKENFIFACGVLSIVLSHHFQKDEIQKLISGTFIEFSKVRDTMYKYSKKAEDKFFKEPILAYLFVWYANNQKGMEYTKQKLVKVGSQREREMGIRIIKEIQNMKVEAIRSEYLTTKRLQDSKICQKLINMSVKHIFTQDLTSSFVSQDEILLESQSHVSVQENEPRHRNCENNNQNVQQQFNQIELESNSSYTLDNGTSELNSSFTTAVAAETGNQKKALMEPPVQLPVIQKIPSVLSNSISLSMQADKFFKSEKEQNSGQLGGQMVPLLKPEFLSKKPQLIMSIPREQKNKLIHTKSQPQAQILTSSGGSTIGTPSIWNTNQSFTSKQAFQNRAVLSLVVDATSEVALPQLAAQSYQQNWEAKNKRLIEQILSDMQKLQQRPDIKLGNCSTKVSEKSE